MVSLGSPSPVVFSFHSKKVLSGKKNASHRTVAVITIFFDLYICVYYSGGLRIEMEALWIVNNKIIRIRHIIKK